MTCDSWEVKCYMIIEHERTRGFLGNRLCVKYCGKTTETIFQVKCGDLPADGISAVDRGVL